MNRCKGRIAAEPKTITPACIMQYPDENFKVSNRGLFLQGNTFVKENMKTAKYTIGKVKLKSKTKGRKILLLC